MVLKSIEKSVRRFRSYPHHARIALALYLALFLGLAGNVKSVSQDLERHYYLPIYQKQALRVFTKDFIPDGCNYFASQSCFSGYVVNLSPMTVYSVTVRVDAYSISDGSLVTTVLASPAFNATFAGQSNPIKGFLRNLPLFYNFVYLDATVVSYSLSSPFVYADISSTVTFSPPLNTIVTGTSHIIDIYNSWSQPLTDTVLVFEVCGDFVYNFVQGVIAPGKSITSYIGDCGNYYSRYPSEFIGGQARFLP